MAKCSAPVCLLFDVLRSEVLSASVWGAPADCARQEGRSEAAVKPPRAHEIEYASAFTACAFFFSAWKRITSQSEPLVPFLSGRMRLGRQSILSADARTAHLQSLSRVAGRWAGTLLSFASLICIRPTWTHRLAITCSMKSCGGFKPHQAAWNCEGFNIAAPQVAILVVATLSHSRSEFLHICFQKFGALRWSCSSWTRHLEARPRHMGPLLLHPDFAILPVRLPACGILLRASAHSRAGRESRIQKTWTGAVEHLRKNHRCCPSMHTHTIL